MSNRRNRANLCRIAFAIMIGMLVGGLGAVLVIWSGWMQPNSRRVLANAKVALARGQFNEVRRAITRVPRTDPLWPSAQLLAGEAAMREGNTQAALTYFQAVPRDGTAVGVLAVFSTAEVRRERGELSAALQDYLYCLRHKPDDVATHERLAFLYGVTGQRWESEPHFLNLARQGRGTFESLALLADLERPVEQPEFVRRCVEQNPSDPLVILAQGAQALALGQATVARERLQLAVQHVPELLAAQSLLGELLVEAGEADFQRWHAALPPCAERYADIWYVRGLYARRMKSLGTAARCFWETLQRRPAHRRATYQLGQVLTALNDPAAAPVSLQASLLFDLTHQLDLVLQSHGNNEVAVQNVVSLLERLGRPLEAVSWARVANQAGENDWSPKVLSRLEPSLLKDLSRGDSRGVSRRGDDGQSDGSRVLSTHNLALKFSFEHFPAFSLREMRPGRVGDPAKRSLLSTVRFEQASDIGVPFTYNNGADLLVDDTGRAQRRTRMFEQTGGGVAVLDFDNDGRPDLFFTQGAPWKFGETAPQLDQAAPDCLFRNQQGRTFEDCTGPARIYDHGFGQGCAVGDFDNDGFADLFVANVGRNRLHRNNGDGTFVDVTDAAGIEIEDWSTSCAIVDLNADGLPDLIEVTYLHGPRIYVELCHGKACSPRNFEGIPDRVRMNRGDGTFELLQDQTPRENSKGLGIVAFCVQPGDRPWLYIANDQVPDQLIVPVPESGPSGQFQLQEQGFASGLAFNEDGLAMASMGIAADDANGDGRLDFFVTNFKDESDILFLQDAPGLFIDATKGSGLRSPTLPFVGWGTQFLDADLDGEPDLVMVNGHVDDYRDEGGEYHMRPQFFRNLGGGKFEEPSAEVTGDYFQRKFLGRGLARLDWNSDGKMDFVVSNIGEPAALVTNKTRATGHFLNLRLHGTRSARDAIGAFVEVSVEGRTWTRQITAGDGYQASNERLLQFGLADRKQVESVRIHWPSGTTTVLRHVPVDCTLEIVEGGRWGTRWTHGEPSTLDVDLLTEIQQASR